MNDLETKLARLGDSVRATTQVKRSARALAWSSLQREHPDHASVISAISAGFGRPARVVVKAGDETLLDSETLR